MAAVANLVGMVGMDGPTEGDKLWEGREGRGKGGARVLGEGSHRESCRETLDLLREE